ncbi:imidazole glycerol phosphate synthase subunit HisF [Devosia oryziradicis]|uniref:Imidazole glycerol phosphate synthase subunit HisF n=1 Tax=Devosia oryziradicis TaxID=2801335 RepID=A0ABX7BU58_9HYPH|nr:AglZ/HisF2 family acetamidino modification protein [Devosia oryziradicis]QQR35331.1 imidazole glycerol phosphate synthase subunit HisF [Devosia oryziradicis]
MLKTRVIPTLLLRGEGLVKTTGFRNPKYVGDPINAIKIFNDKEVDELILLDINATNTSKGPAFDTLEDIAGECFMPVAYGGGISNVEQIRRILGIGIEKVVINSAAIKNPDLIATAAREFGNQAVVVSIDVKKTLLGRYEVRSHSGSKGTSLDPAAWARQVQDLGAGEIMLTSIERDGTMRGYDIDLVRKVSEATNVPLIAAGGAGKLADFGAAVANGADAVAAGAMFVFHGPHRAVLITYPSRVDLEAVL